MGADDVRDPCAVKHILDERVWEFVAPFGATPQVWDRANYHGRLWRSARGDGQLPDRLALGLQICKPLQAKCSDRLGPHDGVFGRDGIAIHDGRRPGKEEVAESDAAAAEKQRHFV